MNKLELKKLIKEVIQENSEKELKRSQSAQKRAINSLNRKYKAEGRKVYEAAKKYIDTANKSDVYMYSFFITDDSREVPGRIYILEFSPAGPSDQHLAITVNDKFQVVRFEAGSGRSTKKFSDIDSALKHIESSKSKTPAKAPVTVKREKPGKTKVVATPKGSDTIEVKIIGADIEGAYNKIKDYLIDQGFNSNEISNLKNDTFEIPHDVEDFLPINKIANGFKGQFNRLLAK